MIEQQPTLDRIIAAICVHYQLTQDELLGIGRYRPRPEARRVMIMILRDRLHYTWYQVRNALRLRSHGSAHQRWRDARRHGAKYDRAIERVWALATSDRELVEPHPRPGPPPKVVAKPKGQPVRRAPATGPEIERAIASRCMPVPQGGAVPHLTVHVRDHCYGGASGEIAQLSYAGELPTLARLELARAAHQRLADEVAELERLAGIETESF